ncbi:NAD-dependent epimerase/dehydratase family protein [Curvibacter sp. CHRR-16]|uniref:NAD-dependent epimerase/dehydratase family protein n=1 Tax=Curvibacter sp. CHRR-16 TaxID=2835872 RepID=UPI001BDA0E98|nr:NAD-dependent epimerase/dehydratase family protein [Curvibacter sp. CHRR-16]MBT0571561.1 NAD-dependent epimerase/dehydratase family protein [Curvibacter sp. CHRR-16]
MHRYAFATLPSSASTRTPRRALPRRFRQARVLVVGCGDVGQRVLEQRLVNVRWLVLTTSTSKQQTLRAQGVHALLGNLDDAPSVRRLAGLAQRVLYLAPPPNHGSADARMGAFVRAMDRASSPRCVVYGSTSAVYGDWAGAWVSESSPASLRSPRGERRWQAERALHTWGLRAGVRTSALRIPGIYAPNRSAEGKGRGAQQRLQQGLPVLHAAEDVYTNHIHADDLARACWLALWRAAPQRNYNVNDNTQLKMGDYLDAVADTLGLPRPPRATRAQLQGQVSAMQWSFMQDSRRMHNERMQRELGLRLRYPTVVDGWAEAVER